MPSVCQGQEAAAEPMEDDASTQSEVSGWETASDDEAGPARSAGQQSAAEMCCCCVLEALPELQELPADAAAPGPGSDADSWEVWDPRRSLFDNHLSDSLEANLEYMWRSFHFSIPDSEYLQDAPGLLTYLVRHREPSWVTVWLLLNSLLLSVSVLSRASCCCCLESMRARCHIGGALI